MKRLDASDIRAIHRALLRLSGENVPGERADVGIVVDLTFETVFGLDPHPTIASKAASYLYRLASGHFFHQGNKRVALMTSMTFLELNGVGGIFTDGELWPVVSQCADADVRPSLDEIVELFERRLRSPRD